MATFFGGGVSGGQPMHAVRVPSRIGIGSSIYRHTFPSAAAWVEDNSRTTLSDDTTYVRHGDGANHNSMKVLGGTDAGGLDLHLTLTEDWSTGKEGRLVFYVPDIAANAALEKINFQIKSAGKTATFKPYDRAREPGFGWFDVSIPSNMIFSGDADVDYSAITEINITAVRDDTSLVEFYLDFMEFHPTSSKSLFSIAFDDGQTDNLAGLEYLANLGLKATVYAVPGLAGTGTYLTIAQLKDVQAMGHLVANHLYDDTTHWKNLTNGQKIDLIARGQDLLLDNGFEGARIFASPGGGTQGWDMDNIIGKYCDHFRATGSYGTTFHWNTLLNNRLSFCEDGGDTAAMDRALTAMKASSGGWVHTYTHTGNPITDAAFKTFCDQVRTDVTAGTYQLVTPDDVVYNRIT